MIGFSRVRNTARLPFAQRARCRRKLAEVVRRLALHEDLVVVVGAPALGVHADRGVEVLGDRVGEHAADALERGAADHRRRAAPEHRVATVLAGADHVEEEGLLVTHRVRVLDRVAVREVVRGLHQRDLRVVEVAEGRLEEVGTGYVVGVERDDEVAVGDRERVVDVPRLRVRCCRGA